MSYLKSALTTPMGSVAITQTRSVSARDANGTIHVKHERTTSTTPTPSKPSDQHSDFWRLDFSSPARSGYLTL